MPLGNKIKRARLGRDLTQPELGALLRPPVGVSTVSRWEADDPDRARVPDADQLRELCRVLHVSADVLIEREPFELPAMPPPAAAPREVWLVTKLHPGPIGQVHKTVLAVYLDPEEAFRRVRSEGGSTTLDDQYLSRGPNFYELDLHNGGHVRAEAWTLDDQPKSDI